MIRFRVRSVALVASLGCGVFVACGGGGSTPTPAPPSTPGGLGSTVPLDQHINFTVLVPPAAVTSSVGASARKRRGALANPTTTNPYVSPNTGSVVLQLETVNGQSLRQAPPPNPPANIPANCIGSANGCSVPIQNVTAAKGVDRFEVETFSGQNGGGNLVSTGFIDVTVPSAQSASFGGTTLTIGGYVAQLSLALNPPGGGFVIHTPGTAQVDVNAIDPAGAIIIGNSILANPITVALGGNDTTNFTLGGTTQVTLQQPMQSVKLAYDGKLTVGGEVDATTVDENGKPVTAKVTVPVAPQTAPPTPNATPLSIYVYDGAEDRILEYDHVRTIEQGVAPAPTETPRRVFQFAAPASGGAVNCGGNGSPPELGGIAVDATGMIYAESLCLNAAGTQQFTYSYPTDTQQVGTTAQPLGTPPPAAVVFAATTIDSNNTGGAPPAFGIKFDAPQNKLFVSYGESLGGAEHIIGFPIGSTVPSNDLGFDCIGEVAYGGCNLNTFSGFYASGSLSNFAVDGAGNAFVPTTYNDTPPGSPAAEFAGEPAVAVATNAPVASPTVVAYSALAGIADELGGSYSSPTVAEEGATLYVLPNLSGAGPPLSNPNGNQFYPGLSFCPPQSSNAPLDEPFAPDPNTGIDTPAPACQDAQQHAYLIGFPVASLTVPMASGQDNIVPWKFILGGDAKGGFGTVGSVAPDGLTVMDGFAYVLNLCTEQNVSTGSCVSPNGEIDVYDVRTITGSHTDTPPIAKIQLPSSISALSIAVGPTGTGTGGFNLLFRRGYARHNVKAWLQQRRRATRYRLLHRH